MKPFGACVFVALLSGALAAPGASEKWASFRAKHGKSYAAHEEQARMARFLERDAQIEAHNAKYEAGEVSFSMKHSQYSDLSNEEFAKQALGYVRAVNVSDIPFAEMSTMPSAPATLDWRQSGIMTSVKNQQNCGSCYAFAGCGVLEAIIKWRTGTVVDIAEQDVVDCSYKRYMGGQHNAGCLGGWPTAVFEYLNQKGLVMEPQYQYTSGYSQTHGQCRYPYAVNDGVRGQLRWQHVRTNENQLIEILATKGPLVLPIAADNNFKVMFDNLGDGVFDNPNAIGLQPNHVVVLVGYGTQGGKNYWLIKNSWGAQWGMNGYGKIVRGKNMCGIMTDGVFYLE